MIDVTRAVYDRDAKFLVLTLQPRDARVSEASLEIGPIAPAASWTLFVDGEPAATGHGQTTTATGALQAEVRDQTIVVNLAIQKATTLVVAVDHG
jgi:hypothetical protein